MYRMIVVYLTAYDDGNDRDEYTGVRGSGLTWRKGAVLGASDGWLEGKNLPHCYQMDASNSASGVYEGGSYREWRMDPRCLMHPSPSPTHAHLQCIRLHTRYIMCYDSKSTASTSCINHST
ncbi:hypothetical protein M422DRAFT_25881 [Sphaerobolus stellatus SS14]|nr:hypothetical protein M422DRAFT_25881 [Sphaerobolus stellatus SS14]